ncbi:MAG: nucleotidyltransferase domain-containing protein [Methanomicrobiaceae archaeon]|uniref:Nucleotidyltransferase, fused to n-terminal dna-binding domain n=1 Tax=hydrocarbon metagenome TaxID=938273 RepID=A0A0W8FGS7_9ZZZZ|nr:nucleotidyltransferase domain-containing protein [Methanomicrobiaceae archaeon]MDD5418482.1 nucleotidyltransferase domain-containing protein [Methanomicrobiaceae archaeon]
MREPVLSDLFRTEERIRVLRYVAGRQTVAATGVVEATGVSKALVSRYLHLLVREEFCTQDGRAYLWEENARSLAVKCLLNIDLLMAVVPLPGWAGGIGVYGSFAEGTNTADSDLDLWVLVDEYTPDLLMLAARVEKTVSAAAGVETNILIITPERLSELRETDEPFYAGLMRWGVTIRGESIDND